MTKEDLLAILKKLLRTERSLDFLLRLDEEDVRTLIVCIRDRLDGRAVITEAHPAFSYLTSAHPS
jgi:hypothetical protein